VTEAVGEGTDEVQTSLASMSLASWANVERLAYTGSAAFTGTGNASDNVITGGAGNDTLNGGVGTDVLNGGAGNDTLLGGAGTDQLVGGVGTDTASYMDATAAVTINLKTGLHTGIAAGDTYDSIETFLGSNYNDTFVGDANGNSFNGSGGTDTIDYSSSAAAVSVNLTTNVVSGGDAQGDTLVAFEKVIGSGFNDTLTSSTSGLTLQGGLGDDLYVVGATGITVTEAVGEGTDEVQTSLASMSLASWANVERLAYTGSAAFTGTGNASDNVITGGAGNDTLTGGAGADQLIGGAGTDTASYTDATAAVTINLATGVNTGFAAGDTYDSIETFLGSNYGDTFVGDANTTNFNGGSGTDTIDYSASSATVNVNLTTNAVSGGNAQGDTLTSFEKVVGSGFSDTLSSSTSGHTLQGGLGDDLYVINVAGVTVSEASDEGGDEIQTSLMSFSLASYANVERLTYTGSVAFTGTGNASDNVITGGTGNDTLSGGAGADEFHGGAGTDTVSYSDSAVGITMNFATGVFSGIASGDTFYDIENIAGSGKSDVFVENGDSHSFASSGGYDIVSYEAATAGITIDFATANQIGIAAGDILTNIEVIQGSAFDDTFVGDGNANNFMGAVGADNITGGAGADGAWYLSSLNAVQITLGGTVSGGDATGDTLTGIENLVGSSFADLLIGDAGNNRLDGGDGNDAIAGGDGADNIYGDLGGDFGITGSGALQVDELYGGDGNDYIQTATNDAGSLAYGEAGNDTVQVNHGEAFGGIGNDFIAVTGNGTGYGEGGDDDLWVTNGGVAFGGSGQDKLTGSGSGYNLFGGDDFDTLNLFGNGEANGEQHGDIYNIYTTTGIVDVRDTGTLENDYLYMRNVPTANAMAAPLQIGVDLYLTSATDMLDGHQDSGVRLVGWFEPVGGHFIEFFRAADLSVINVA
jgi:Ca2+-binding RTX toxin-like protein